MRVVQLKNNLFQSIQTLKRKFHLQTALKLMFTVFLVAFNFYATAQSTTTTLPNVDIAGASQQTDPWSMVVVIFKFIIAGALWAATCYSGFKTVTEIMKSWHKSRRDEEFKWPAVMGDIAGHIILFILVLILAIYMTATFTK